MKWNRRGRPDPEVLKDIMAAKDSLVAQGMSRPPIRAVLYILLDIGKGWTKKLYSALTSQLGAWRDAGFIPYELFSDESGGKRYVPYTARYIRSQVSAWQATPPARLLPNGTMAFLFVEHIALVEPLREMTDNKVAVVSSQGQIRRENLHTFMKELERAAQELGAKGIKGASLADWDLHGSFIYNTHRTWFASQHGVRLKKLGITRAQIVALGLDPSEHWQMDGIIGRDVAGFRAMLRAEFGLDGPSDVEADPDDGDPDDDGDDDEPDGKGGLLGDLTDEEKEDDWP